MKTVGWQPMLPGNQPMSVIFTKQLTHSTGPQVGEVVSDQKELVYREEAEAEIAAAVQNLRAYREDSTVQIERLQALAQLVKMEFDRIEKQNDELIGQLSQVRNERDNWMETSAQFHRNQQYYERIVRKVGALFGTEAYTSDDGSVQDEVLAEKVYELALANYGKRPHGSNRFTRAWNALMGR